MSDKSKVVIMKPSEDKTTAAKMKARAKELDKEISVYDQNERESAMSLGWAAAEMKRGNLWQLLGHEKETEYRLAKNIGRSTYFRYRRLAEAFWRPDGKGLERKEFIKLKAENADHLAILTDKHRFNPKLIEKAQTLTEEEFQKLLVKFKAAEDRVDEGEVIVTLKMKMPESRRQVILETVAWFAGKHGMDADDVSRVIELICAEIKNQKAVVTETMQTIQLLGEATKLLSKPNGKTHEQVVEECIGIFMRVYDGLALASGVKLKHAGAVH